MKRTTHQFPRLVALNLLVIFLISCGTSYSNIKKENPEPPSIEAPAVSPQKIMLALLLDTSNSMDGLIEQAKSQLWTIVNELSAAKCTDGTRPEVKIALFEYGNDGLPAAEGYIRMVTNLTGDLDEISEKLFNLTTNGGDEYCGHVIQKSIKKLDWSESNADLKMIFIAGNEPFTQGSVSYQMACHLAKEKDIIVNTIFCGDFNEGIRTTWKQGADLTGGSYMSIGQNQQTVYVNTPYDDKIDRLNDEVNKTYIQYGRKGQAKKELQLRQDNNASSYGQANKAKRSISKSSHIYKNQEWDLVDAAEDNESIIAEAEEEYLPEEMKGKTVQQKKDYVSKQSNKRTALQKEIRELGTKRKQYIAQNQPTNDSENMLDKVMVNSIKKIAKTKQLIFE
jgi:hypothetical protein